MIPYHEYPAWRNAKSAVCSVARRHGDIPVAEEAAQTASHHF